jgi:hypothetical protein
VPDDTRCRRHARCSRFRAADGVLERLHGDDRRRGGVERRAGVPPPESRNAAQTLVAMAVLSITMFVGITLLAHAYGIVPNDARPSSRRSRAATFGGRGCLLLRAGGDDADPRAGGQHGLRGLPALASILARDRFLPRQFMNQGDRLAFSNGIVILSVLASVLLVVFGGDTHALIPLYMIGVFVSFTLSQAGW